MKGTEVARKATNSLPITCVVAIASSVTSPDPDPVKQSSSSHGLPISGPTFWGFLVVGVGFVEGMYTGVIKSSSPEPVSGSGGHSSSSSPLQPDPAPLKIRSSSTPGKPDAGVCNKLYNYILCSN